MKELDLKGKKTLVVGLARSGVAAANFLVQRQANVTVTDVKNHQQLSHSIAQVHGPVRYLLGGHPEEAFLDADLIVLSPGVPTRLEVLARARERGIPIWNEIELAYRFLRGNIIGITGSNGKTTTTALVGEMFKAARRRCFVAGNIGRPLVDLVTTQQNSVAPTFVLELSSFQLENLDRFKCGISVLLNVTPDHLDRYPSFAEYADAKRRIFRNQTPADYAVINADDLIASRMAEACPGRCVLFSRRQRLPEGAFVENQNIVMQWQGRHHALMNVGQIRLRGPHNLENALAATAVGCLSKLPLEAIRQTLQEFPGVEHRLEFVGEVDGVVFYNDSKATNVDSAAVALQSFRQPVLAIMGGRDKQGDFERLKPLMSKVRKLFLIGEAAERIRVALGSSAETILSGSLEDAVWQAFQAAKPGDAVLLSPACSSFDMFENYEERGKAFKKTVHSLEMEITLQ